jgi:hypothetical protein
MLKIQSIMADQNAAKPSENGRVPMTQNDIIESMTVSPKIEYLQIIDKG